MKDLTYKRAVFLISYTFLLFALSMNLALVFEMINRLFSAVIPIFIGIFIAFIVNLPLEKIEEGLNIRQKHRRSISIFISYFIFLLFFMTILFFLAPEVTKSVENLIINSDEYLENFDSYLNEIKTKLKIPQNVWNKLNINANSIIEIINRFFVSTIPNIFEFTKIFATGTMNFVLGIILSFYFLFNKEKLVNLLNRIINAFISEKKKEYLKKIGKITNKSFKSFITGQLLEAVILGTLCTIGLLLLRVDYAMLIGITVGFFAIIPIFGAILSVIPSILLLLVSNPPQVITFLIFIIILQQIEGDFIYPRVVGKSIGISGISVMISIIIFGNLFGFIGILVGVPVFKVILIIINDFIEWRISKKEN